MEEKEKRKRQVCPVCGGSSFDWGIIGSGYFPLNRRRFIRRGELISARRCLTCGNLHHFTVEPALTKKYVRIAVVSDIVGIVLNLGILGFITLTTITNSMRF
jgi:hypothetical protein